MSLDHRGWRSRRIHASVTFANVSTVAARNSTARDCEIELCELGALGVRREGVWTAIRGERTKAALAAMSLRGSDGIRTEALLEAVWPSPDQPTTARQSLANLVCEGAFGIRCRLRRIDG